MLVSKYPQTPKRTVSLAIADLASSKSGRSLKISWRNRVSKAKVLKESAKLN